MILCYTLENESRFCYNFINGVYVMKKLFSIILLITFCCISFVGCTAKENTETTNNSNENGDSTVTENTLPQKHTIP